MKIVLLLPAIALLAACDDGARRSAVAGDAERGRVALYQYACNACHMIPGVTGSKVFVGPELGGLPERRFIAGSLPNNPENLARWIRHPKEVDQLTAMPDLGVTETDARDMVAYLWRQ